MLVKLNFLQLEIAGPGFINICLNKEFLQQSLADFLVNGVRIQRKQENLPRVSLNNIMYVVCTTNHIADD